MKITQSKLSAFLDIYNTFYSVIYASIYYKINNLADIDDICQELFERFYQNMEKVQNPRAWLYGTLRIITIEYYKQKGKREEDIEDLLDSSKASYVNGFRDTRILLQEAMDSEETFETDKDRAIFELVAVCNRSIADAARHTGMTYRIANYSYKKSVANITRYLQKKGIMRMEDLL